MKNVKDLINKISGKLFICIIFYVFYRVLKYSYQNDDDYDVMIDMFQLLGIFYIAAILQSKDK